MTDTVNRRVVQIEPTKDGVERAPLRIFDFLGRNQIILLGDPGAGKTYCFHRMAAAEGAEVLSVQKFIARDGAVRAGTVYLDGFDEYRPRTKAGESTQAIALLQILRRIGGPRLRLSCRFADWLGSTDLELFKDYCADTVVLALNPLEPEEAVEILAARGVPEPRAFLAEATAKHIEWALPNPLSLVMLADVVRHSGWPKTRHELYEQWSLRHLAEQKEALQNSPLGGYPAADLLDPAGAACAAALISDISGLRLGPSSDDQTPSYQSVPFSNQEPVLAALSRGVFSAAEPGIVTPVHRAIAEYLGARHLGNRVDHGLPLSRILALLGVDAHPSRSLRGLHAWLPVFVPLQAPALISKDPLGVLIYGDAASLRPSHKSDLIKSIANVAAENAWFLSEGLSDYGLAALSSPETAEQLIDVLRSQTSPAPLRTLVLRAVSVGEPLARYRPQLESIFADPTAAASDRRLAFRSLLRYGPEAMAAIVRTYRAAISSERQSIGLRSEIVGRLYGRPFGPQDVVAVLTDATVRPNSPVFGELYALEGGISGRNFLEVLEEYERTSARRRSSTERPTEYEVPLFVEYMIARLCEALPENDADRADRLVNVLRGVYEKSLAVPGAARLGEILSAKPGLVRMLVDSAVRRMDEFQHPAAVGFTLNRATEGAITLDLFVERLLAEFDDQKDTTPFPPEKLRKYEALGRCLYGSGPETATAFERFMEIGGLHPECKPLLEASTICEIDERRFQQGPYEAARSKYWAWLRQAVDRELPALLRGENLPLQGELAMLYWGFLSGGPERIRRKQLILALGEPSVDRVEQGFLAIVETQPPPSLQDISVANAANESYWHWYAFLAGMDLLWERRLDLSALSKATLLAAYALSLLLDTFDENGEHCPGNAREWSRRILRDRPDVAEEACRTLLVEVFLQRKGPVSLLHRLPGAASAPWRPTLALGLLANYDITDDSDLGQLCAMAMESDDGQSQVAAIAQQRVLESQTSSSAVERFWLVAGFVTAGELFEPKLTQAALANREVLRIVKSLTERFAHTTPAGSPFVLNTHQMEYIVRTFAPFFPSAPPPSAGWGEHSDFDLTMYLSGLVTAISTRTDLAAGASLARLLGSPELASYHAWISGRLAEQREANRQSRYEKPSWTAVCGALRGGAPANIEDLKALFLDDLRDAAADIRHSNLDRYRVFWTGKRSKLSPLRDEDYCRDRLVEYLRARLEPIDLWVEPEGHMAADKRADMVVLGPNAVKLPVEVKRDTHPELWIAARNQLERLYTRDPNAQGYGVYLVLYFGPGRRGRFTPNPDGVVVADSPAELESALNASIPLEHRDRITCAVIDVSPPALPRSASKPGRTGTRAKARTPSAASSSSKPARKVTTLRESAPKKAANPKKPKTLE
jgi:hypothetical protein